jgi:toxin secretion/phage lysis holin
MELQIPQDTIKLRNSYTNMSEFFNQLGVFFSQKMLSGISASAILGSITFYMLGINPELVFILFVMAVFDTITGVLKSKKLGIPLTSAKAFAFPSKIVLYFISISAFRLAGRAATIAYGLPEEAVIGAATGVVLWLIGWEIKSIIENFDEMGMSIPQWIKDKLSSFFNGQSRGQSE